MRFSQRIGKTKVKEVLQIESIDSDLQNRLWNSITQDFFNLISANSQHGGKSPKMKVCEYIWREFFNKTIDKFPTFPMIGPSEGAFISFVRDWFYKAEWYEIYDLIEFLFDTGISVPLQMHFTKSINDALSKEISGYRVVDRNITQITNEEEISSIEDALKNSNKWQSVNSHLSAALVSLTDRNNPNYRNSIKESISAVEALCKIITGDDKATLGKALNDIEKKHKIHGALKSAFSSLYGYTSDSGGIRHSLLENDSIVDADEAKFMLVSCSAFINYLIAKS
ncbi:MAG TPA: hypothetical protein VK183_00340 [Flavobacterium sp.]|nr:hypothetical protein [Flavobacterium sp.]